MTKSTHADITLATGDTIIIGGVNDTYISDEGLVSIQFKEKGADRKLLLSPIGWHTIEVYEEEEA